MKTEPLGYSHAHDLYDANLSAQYRWIDAVTACNPDFPEEIKVIVMNTTDIRKRNTHDYNKIMTIDVLAAFLLVDANNKILFKETGYDNNSQHSTEVCNAKVLSKGLPEIKEIISSMGYLD
jgi:hypothetical protein